MYISFISFKKGLLFRGISKNRSVKLKMGFGFIFSN